MTQHGSFVTLGELLDEHAETDQDEDILERVKVLAQEHLPDGWTRWEVTTATKEEVFGEKIEPNVLDKLVYALPTVGLARAFVPEADHLSDMGYRQIRCKLLDWAFTRALILGPPAVANRIRGSAGRTELFKQSVEVLRPLLYTRAEADRILSGSLSETVEISRKRRYISSSTSRSHEPLALRNKRYSYSSSTSRDSHSPSSSQDARIDALEQKLDSMFSVLLKKLEQRQLRDSKSVKKKRKTASKTSNSSSWKAPAFGLFPDWQVENKEVTKEADPVIRKPSA